LSASNLFTFLVVILRSNGNTSKRVWEKLSARGEIHNARVDFPIMANGEEHNIEKNTMDTSSTFLFEVVFRDNFGSPGVIHRTSANDRSVIVEVEPDTMLKTASDIPSGDAARRYSKELAPQFAMQVVQKDLPHGFEVMEIDHLPCHLHHRPPKFQGNRFSAWILKI
jgi:hypothetical protein